MKFTVVIVEDEPFSRKNLQTLLLTFCSSFEIIGHADSIETTVAVIKDLSPDLVFLDVQLKDGISFDIFEKLDLSVKTPKIVFTTAFDSYAIKAFKVNAVDYLLKPIDPDQLIELEKKLLAQKEEEDQRIQSKVDQEKKHKKLIPLPTSNGIEYFMVEDILRCEGESNYTHVHFTSEVKKIIVSKSLKEFEELFSDLPFFRVHKSHLIHIEKISTINSKNNTLQMIDGTTIEIARRRRQDFFDLMQIR